jgi:hypothetical protein
VGLFVGPAELDEITGGQCQNYGLHFNSSGLHSVRGEIINSATHEGLCSTREQGIEAETKEGESLP